MIARALCLLVGICLTAQHANAEEEKVPYSDKGADTCLKCHDEDNEYPVFPIFETKHARMSDARSPMAKLQCETCHGPGGKHQEKAKKGEKKAPIRSFGKKSWVPIKDQNKVCLSCHEDHNRNNWKGSSHESNDLACASCHQIHKKRDPMLVKMDQVNKCTSCHTKQKAEFQRTSSHPIRFGELKCSNCHNPHGSNGEYLLKFNTKNETCYSCHAEKRGPLLWTHAPVQEDCGNCHNSHGSIHPALLKKRPPLLCQQCHSPNGHPRIARDGGGLGTASVYLLNKSCLNCHGQIHGSNHPSGVRFTR